MGIKNRTQTGSGMEERGQGRWEEEKKEGERRGSRGGVKDQKGEEKRKRRDRRGSSLLLLLSHSSLSLSLVRRSFLQRRGEMRGDERG